MLLRIGGKGVNLFFRNAFLMRGYTYTLRKQKLFGLSRSKNATMESAVMFSFVAKKAL